MNPYSITTAFVTFLILSISGYFFIIGGRANKTFSLVCLLTGLWQLSWTILFNVNSVEIAEWIARVGHIPILFIPLAIILFFNTYVFKLENRQRIRWIALFTMFLSVINLFTSLIIDGVEKHYFGFYPKAGILHPLFIAFISLILTYTFVHFVKNISSQQISRKSSLLLLIGIFVYSGSALDFITNYGISFYPIGFFFITLFIILFGSSIYNELNTQLVDLNNSLELRIFEATDKIKSQQQQLIQAEKLSSLGTMAAGLAHEINNPLNFLKPMMAKILKVNSGLIEIIKKEPQIVKSPGFEELSNKIKLQKYIRDEAYINEQLNGLVQKISNIVDDVKNYTIDSKKAEKKKSSIKDIINAAVNPLIDNYKETVDFQMNIQDFSLLCNPTQIDQVLTNCLINSIHACEGQEGKIMISTSSSEKSIIITDNGIGLEESYKTKVFDPFFTTKPPGKGTGLGLSLSREIILNHGGVISIENNGATKGCIVLIKFKQPA